MRRRFLIGLLTVLDGYDEDLTWVAAHAATIASYLAIEPIGLLLAAAIDLGGSQGREIDQILRDSASGQHETGQMGRHVTAAFLCSANAECWDFVANLLLAAQRQEGLRQVILESIDFSHPAAFRRMLRVIEDNNLTRFSATIRAADVWLGMPLDSASENYVSEIVRSLIVLLDDEDARALALAGADAQRAFLALWSIAFEDAPAAIDAAAKLAKHKSPESRFVAVQLLGMLGLRVAYEPILPAVDDLDLRVAAYATLTAGMQLEGRIQAQRLEDAGSVGGLGGVVGVGGVGGVVGLIGREARFVPPPGSGDLFERLERLHDRVPEKPPAQKPIAWPWMTVRVDRQIAAEQMPAALGDRAASRLLPYLDTMSPAARMRSAQLLATMSNLDPASRLTLVRLVGDPSPIVREAAVQAVKQIKVTTADLTELEPLLETKKSDQRRSVLTLLLSLDDDGVLECVRRLTGSQSLARRKAGLDLLRQMRDANRSVAGVRALAEVYRADHASLTHDERVYLDALSESRRLRSRLMTPWV